MGILGKQSQLIRWAFGFLRPVKREVLLACLVLTLWTGAEITAVRVTAEAVNGIGSLETIAHVDEGGAISWILGRSQQAVVLRGIILILAGVTLSHAVLAYLREVANMRLSMNMVFHIRESVYDKLQRAGFGFHDALSTGELINRSLTDLQHVRGFLNSAVLAGLEILLIVIGYVVVLMLRSPWVAVLALAPTPLWTWYILRFSRRAQPALRSAMEAGDRDTAIITENIAGVHVVKAFSAQQQEIDKYCRNCDEFFSRVMRRIRMFADFTPVMRGIAAVAHLMMFLAAGVLIIKGRFAAGDMLMLGSAMGAILGRLQQLTIINEQYQHAVVSAQRLHEILNSPATVPLKPDARALPPGPGSVRFENVTFGYDPDKPVLKDIDFEIPGGSTIAIVGPTGAGKTTLVSLLARFYDPQRGRVLIDGTDIRETTLDSVRSQIAYVFQETFLFSDSVEANIAYGSPDAIDTHVEVVARLAQAHEFIELLPQGYQTRLGDRGSNLSGGQRQRLAIARAILSNPRILVLDDATAAVDSETEEDIRKALRYIMEDRTVFVIAHRISTVKHADRVIVLEQGRITQMGTHEELLLQEGHYRQIVSLQLYGAGEPAWQGDMPSHFDRMQEFVRRPVTGVRPEEDFDDTAG